MTGAHRRPPRISATARGRVLVAVGFAMLVVGALLDGALLQLPDGPLLGAILLVTTLLGVSVAAAAALDELDPEDELPC